MAVNVVTEFTLTESYNPSITEGFYSLKASPQMARFLLNEGCAVTVQELSTGCYRSIVTLPLGATRLELATLTYRAHLVAELHPWGVDITEEDGQIVVTSWYGPNRSGTAQ